MRFAGRAPRAALRALVLSLALLACKSETEGAAPLDLGPEIIIKAPCEGKSGDDLTQCATTFYLGPSRNDAPAACGPLPTSRVSAQARVKFFRGPNTAYDDAASQGMSLTRYYEPYGLTFVASADAESVEYAQVLTGTVAELEKAVVDAGYSTSGPYTPEEEVAINAIVSGILFRNVRATVGTARGAETKIVVVDEIASSELNGLIGGGLGVIAGLGLSPVLLTNFGADDAESKNFFELMGLPPDFTPTLFIGFDTLNQLARGSDVIAAHEMGHTLGLQHLTGDKTNLMAPVATTDCQPVMNDAQLAEIAKNLAVTLPDAPAALLAISRAPARVTAAFAARRRK